MKDTKIFNGLQILANVGKAEPGTPRHRELTDAIAQWRTAATGTGQDMDTCNNAARELEIERDHGVIVHINTRTKPPGNNY